MNKHTPGPWTSSDEGHWSLISDGKNVLATVWHYTDGEEGGKYMQGSAANAALMAAAPDLLETLRTIVANASSVQLDPQWAVMVARNAIAKAEGKTV